MLRANGRRTKPTMTRRYPFVHLDVFTREPLTGNGLVVFTDARGLSDDEMQALARETNLSETTFVLPRDAIVERERGVHVRIFTVEEELDFAGHPTLGTAYVLHRQGGGETITLDLRVGRIPVTFARDAEGALAGEMRQRDPEFGRVHEVAAVARATGLPLDAFATDVPIETVSTGLPFTVTPLRSLTTLGRLRLDWPRAEDYLRTTDARFFYFVCRETVDPLATLHARMIFYNGEDPATGSAAGCCTAWALRHGVIQSGQRAVIEQGIEMHRPSEIFVRGTVAGERVTDIRVGGHVVEVMRGEVTL
jgi:trans-2,3-dihydro-3-hydroxyanthranilate isomerase